MGYLLGGAGIFLTVMLALDFLVTVNLGLAFLVIRSFFFIHLFCVYIELGQSLADS